MGARRRSSKDRSGSRPSTAELHQLGRHLGHVFARPALLEAALTHTSATQHGPGETNYERLEFLGDRVIGVIVAELLLARFPEEGEGALALRQADLVRRDTLAAMAEDLGLAGHVRLAKGEEAAGERRNPAILADVCEALLGALYLDGGLEVAREIILPHVEGRLEAAEAPPQDAKTRLQEWAQARSLALPRYLEVARDGPPHAPHFTVEVVVEGAPRVRGEGSSKRLAEQEAAAALLQHMETEAQ